MSEKAPEFLSRVKDADKLTDKGLVDFFVYFLTVEEKQTSANVTAIANCFVECDLTPPARIAPYLSEGLTSKPQRFVKADGGYKLHRNFREALSVFLNGRREKAQIGSQLRKLVGQLPNAAENEFLKETIDCFEAGANRATVIMCWILTVDHLIELVLRKHLVAFNGKLAKELDKRVRVSKITSKDDFSDIPENKFIELLRASGVISNDVRKILDSKLGIRNSSAHPSGISIKASKVIDFVDDLLENVLLKYPL